MGASHNQSMESPQFADEFDRLYREVYRVAVRRIGSGREQLSAGNTHAHMQAHRSH
jgi:hypothetical protein